MQNYRKCCIMYNGFIAHMFFFVSSTIELVLYIYSENRKEKKHD
jgi:hypothetical protein